MSHIHIIPDREGEGGHGEYKKHVLLTYPSAHSSLPRRLSAAFFPGLCMGHL